MSFILISAILLILCGCQTSEGSDGNTIIFYYRQADYTHSPNLNVIVGEERTLSGGRDNLSFLLTLYLLGPLDDKLVSPLPPTAFVESILREDNSITITLSSMDSYLSDSEFTVASACLAETILGLTQCEYVTICSGQRTITLDTTNTLAKDNVSPAENTTEATQ